MRFNLELTEDVIGLRLWEEEQEDKEVARADKPGRVEDWACMTQGAAEVVTDGVVGDAGHQLGQLRGHGCDAASAYPAGRSSIVRHLSYLKSTNGNLYGFIIVLFTLIHVVLRH